MLGYGSLGSFALGSVPVSTTVVVLLVSKISAMARLRGANSPLSALQSRIDASCFARAQMSPTSPLSARAKAMLAVRAPGGLTLTGRIALMTKARTTPGYILYARVMLASSALTSIHFEGTLTPPRLPLLLNSGSQYGASYWKGRD